MIIMMPVMALLIIPLVATFDVKNVDVVVVDNDHSQLSRRIIADIDASHELSVLSIVGTHDEAMPHGMGTIMENCTRAVWIEKGKLVMMGDVKRVCEAYRRMKG